MFSFFGSYFENSKFILFSSSYLLLNYFSDSKLATIKVLSTLTIALSKTIICLKNHWQLSLIWMKNKTETANRPAVEGVTTAIPIIHPIHMKINVTYPMFAPKALDMFQKQMFPRQDSLTLLANSFNKENRLLNIFIWIRPEIIYPTILKTGLFSFKSSCFIERITFLQ